METQGLRNGVDECEIRNTSWHNVAEVQANKVPVFDDSFVAHARDVDEDEEDDGDEEKKGGC